MRSEISGIEQRGKAGQIFVEVLDDLNRYHTPSGFVNCAYSLYAGSYSNHNSASTNGKVFEFLVAEILLREQVIPFYFQARLNHVPNAEFDFVCFDPTRPVVLSCKVSLRERYKQADLEGMALKQVYRLAESHLITLSKEATGVKKKIKNGDVVGLTSCIRADQAEFDDFVERLVK